MRNPITLLLCLAPFLRLTTIRQLSRVSQAILTMTGRVTMQGMARWSGTGGSYRTIQRFFATVLPWEVLFWVFFCTHLRDPDDVYLVGGDETVVGKAGKKTHGLERFFSSLAGKPVPGLAFFTLSLISTKQRRSFPMQVAQMFRARGEPASAPDATPPPVEPTPQRKPGRPRKDATPPPVEPAPTRKPGRPRKDATPPPVEPAPKRRRRRPCNDTTPPLVEPAPKRKPGRPRKDATPPPVEPTPKRKPERPRNDTTPPPVEPASKRKPGRPKGSKTGAHAAAPLSSELQRIGMMLGELLARIGGQVPLTYLVLDGHFGNAPSLQMTRQHGLHLISKLRNDAALYLPYTGAYAGRGPRRKYGEKVDYANIPEHYLRSTTVEGKLETRVYQLEVWNKSFSERLNVVIIVKTRLDTQKRAHVVLFSSDLSLAAASLIDYYALRFQLEFNFRDAKQFWGLEDFMHTHATQVTNAANLSLFMVNFAHCLLRPFRERDPEFSLLDLKAHYRGLKYVEETMKMLPKTPEPSLLERIVTRITSLGRIHPAEAEPIPV
jgi:hypothetical protein